MSIFRRGMAALAGFFGLAAAAAQPSFHDTPPPPGAVPLSPWRGARGWPGKRGRAGDKVARMASENRLTINGGRRA